MSKRPLTIENRWDILYRDYPQVYEEFASCSYQPYILEWLPQRFGFCGKTVADIGCGTGKSVVAFARQARKVYGIEPELAMRRLAATKIADAGLTNLELVAGSMDQVPLPDGSVDFATYITAPINPQEALRVLRPGGTVIHVGITPGWYGGELCSVIGEETRDAEFDRWLIADEGFSYEDVDSLQDYGTTEKIVST